MDLLIGLLWFIDVFCWDNLSLKLIFQIWRFFSLGKGFKVEVSARHVHLTREAVDVLFGKGHRLQIKKNLSQPGQFACTDKVTIVGPKSKIENVSVLGPERSKVQVEVSLTDSRKIGVDVPVRESGSLDSTPGCELLGPNGSLKLESGLIIAKRHIHANFEDAKCLEVSDGQEVWVKILSKQRQLIFGEVVVRVSNSFVLAMHIDTDEANAACCDLQTFGEIVNVG